MISIFAVILFSYLHSPLILDTKIIEYSEKYHVDPNIAKAIIHCESGDDPNALMKNTDSFGLIWSKDYSWWQINDYYWGDMMKKKGWDITKPDDNLEAGFFLLKLKGKKQWYLSSTCQNTMLKDVL